MTVGELLDQVAAEIAVVEASASVREDYERLLLELGLPDDEELRRDYVRIKLAFEATRAGGLWGIEWDITNELPQSDLIWRQWQALELDPEADLPTTTAIAECDELSALFAYVAHRIGLSKRSEVGLFWPTGNHTVAVWTIDRRGDDPKRIVVPTSQIFLEPMDSLGTHGFNPRKQRKIFDYRTADIELTAELPAELARRFAWAVEDHGAHSQADLQQRRNDRERRQWAEPDDTLSE